MNPKEDPWDYSVEGTQLRSLGGFSEEGFNDASLRACENGEHGRGKALKGSLRPLRPKDQGSCRPL